MVSQTTQWVNLGITGFLLVVACIITAMTLKYSPSLSTTTSCDIRPQKGDTSTVADFIQRTWTGTSVTATTTKCSDLRTYLFPKLVFKPSNQPGCTTHFTVKQGVSGNTMKLSSWSIAPDEVQYCTEGTYDLHTNVTATPADPAARLTITKGQAGDGPSTFTVDTLGTYRTETYFISRPEASYTVVLTYLKAPEKTTTTIGTWTNTGLQNQLEPGLTVQNCVDRRHALADGLDAETKCASQQSQFCSCVTSFTSHIRNDATVLQGGIETLRNGIQQCTPYTRQMDQAVSCTDVKTIYVFLAFTLLVVLGAILEAVKPYLGKWDMGVGIAVWVAVAAVAAIFTFIANISIGIVTLVSLVAVALAGLYWAYILNAVGVLNNKIGLYTLIGYFSAGITLLMLFTLLTRGVTDLDVLLVATGKCVALTVLYGALLAYYTSMARSATTDTFTYKEEVQNFGKTFNNDVTVPAEYNIAPLHDSKRLLILLVILLSSDHLFIPYATPSAFEVHWLLPTLFTWAMLAPMLHSGFEDNFKAEDATTANAKNPTKTGSLLQAAIPTIILFYLCVYHLQAYMYDVRPFTPVEQQIFFSS